ncbi:hypothetical protein [Defluviimonas salinarum]|uniref:Uncharacterized protein n=1 Tax=Defluviimonas salinarum TaxID=2992147 RepID=A0ABT3J474_9RHOB|nr:hypothetical protein [Defluviimonas salinarum]MCW3782494.1 hypothetical protein [Defluviimonas salinarum]
MKKSKLSIAIAALMLGMQFGSAAVAAVSATDLQTVEDMVEAGQINELSEFIAANPSLLDISGALGAALNAFAVAPSATTLNAVKELSNGDLSTALASAMGASNSATTSDGEQGRSIY